jgi:hypothetical protein
MGYETKDSEKRYVEESGFQRDTQEDKPQFGLLLPKGIPYKEQMITRWAELMTRGAKKYNSRNWEKANSQEALDRAKESLLRHAIQACTDEQDEDHLAATMFNAMFIATLQYKLRNKK